MNTQVNQTEIIQNKLLSPPSSTEKGTVIVYLIGAAMALTFAIGMALMCKIHQIRQWRHSTHHASVSMDSIVSTNQGTTESPPSTYTQESEHNLAQNNTPSPQR